MLTKKKTRAHLPLLSLPIQAAIISPISISSVAALSTASVASASLASVASQESLARLSSSTATPARASSSPSSTNSDVVAKKSNTGLVHVSFDHLDVHRRKGELTFITFPSRLFFRAIAGGGVAGLAVLALAGGFFFLISWRNKKRREQGASDTGMRDEGNGKGSGNSKEK